MRRNIWTNEKYDKAITVLPIPGDELGRGRGGALHNLSTGTRWYLKEDVMENKRTGSSRWAAMLLKRGEPLES